jgi:hypothetical protein
MPSALAASGAVGSIHVDVLPAGTEAVAPILTTSAIWSIPEVVARLSAWIRLR